MHGVHIGGCGQQAARRVGTRAQMQICYQHGRCLPVTSVLHSNVAGAWTLCTCAMELARLQHAWLDGSHDEACMHAATCMCATVMAKDAALPPTVWQLTRLLLEVGSRSASHDTPTRQLVIHHYTDFDRVVRSLCYIVPRQASHVGLLQGLGDGITHCDNRPAVVQHNTTFHPQDRRSRN
jgi:hypothetical protein